MILSSRLFQTPLDADLKPDRVSHWLTDTAWDQLMRENEPTQVFLGTVPIHLTQLFLQSGPSFKVREAGRQVVDWVGSIVKR